MVEEGEQKWPPRTTPLSPAFQDLNIRPGDIAQAMYLVRAFLEQHQQQIQVAAFQRLVPAQLKVYTVGAPLMRTLAQAICHAYARDPSRLFPLFSALWDAACLETRLLIGYILEMAGLDHLCTLDMLERYLAQSENWAVCDTLSLLGAGRILIRHPSALTYCHRGARSPHKWLRRAAAATIPCFYHGQKGLLEALDVLTPMMAEADKEVQKGMGWALRAITCRFPEEVFTFLKIHVPNANPATRWTIRHGMTKLPQGQQELLKRLLKRSRKRS